MVNIVIVFLFCAIYSITRYVVFDPDNIHHLPVLIMNKVVSMAAALCFVFAFWQQWRRGRGIARGNEPATWFRTGIYGAFMHVPMSLAILKPSYFPEFFLTNDRLSFKGETVFFFGALTVGGIYLLTRAQWTSAQRWWLSLITMITLFTHTLAMGIARGMNIKASHGYLPPMWLLSLIGIGLGTVYLLRSRPGSDAAVPPSSAGAPQSTSTTAADQRTIR